MGGLLGDRLNFIYKDMVPAKRRSCPTLVPVFAYFKQDRRPGETFGDFCHRKGPSDMAAWTDRYRGSNSACVKRREQCHSLFTGKGVPL